MIKETHIALMHKGEPFDPGPRDLERFALGYRADLRVWGLTLYGRLTHMAYSIDHVRPGEAVATGIGSPFYFNVGNDLACTRDELKAAFGRLGLLPNEDRTIDLNAWIDEVHDVNVANGWFEDGRSFGDMVALLHSEVSEMLEAFRTWKLEDGTAPGGKPEGVGSEAADVLIRLLDMAYRYDIDLVAEYRRKIEHNRSRGYRHGGRTL